MARLTKEEKLKSIEQKQADLEMQKKKLQAEINKEKRNARTKRLIESAATIESILDVELNKENAAYYSKCIQLGLIAIKFLGREFDECDIQGLDYFLQAQEDRGNYFSSFMNNYYNKVRNELSNK